MTVPLGDSGWRAWRSAALRGPGFPASGLDRLTAPECGAAADGFIQGADRRAFAEAFAKATARMSEELRAIAANPLFREAVTWQSLNSVEALDGLARATGARNSKQRQREIVVTRYWQRYCGKNDTIGFFGPACWATFADATSVKPGPGLVRERVVDLEWRALDAYAAGVAADPQHRPHQPVTRQPHLALDGRKLLQVGAPPRELTAGEAAILAAADGTRTAAEIAGAAPLRTAEDAFLALENLAAQGLLRWGRQLPLTIEAQDGERPFEAARQRLAQAAGDADAVRAAMLQLREEFVAATGADPDHRPGATYAGRGVAYEETLRDLDVELGQPVLDALAPSLVPLLNAARWLTAHMASAFVAGMRTLCRDDMPLGDVFHLALGLIFSDDGPVGEVLSDFSQRLSTLDDFEASAPGWAAARVHSPDLHLIFDGDEVSAVLGELHIAWITCNGGYLTRFHPAPKSLREALHRDIGDRVILLYPPDFPEFTARIAFTLDGPEDVRLGYTGAPAPDLSVVVPLAALRVGPDLVVRHPDGRSWPLVEVFGAFLSSRAVDAFKMAAPGPHTPRITHGRLVIRRETWRTTVGDCGLGGKRIEEADAYVAVRRWRLRLGLPERVFIRVGSEVKPCYVDFSSPAYVAAFVAMVRAAQRAGGDAVPLTVTEMLPTPEQAWVPDAAGQTYFSELRMTVVDPCAAPTARWSAT